MANDPLSLESNQLMGQSTCVYAGEACVDISHRELVKDHSFFRCVSAE